MWHSCRQNEKMITGMMHSFRKRAERRKAYFAKRQGDPLQTVQLSGTSVKLYKDPVQYYSAENEENLMPWQGQHDNKIDRFDARSMLDIIFEYDPKTLAPPTDEERELESLLNYERYRCIIDNYSKEGSFLNPFLNYLSFVCAEILITPYYFNTIYKLIEILLLYYFNTIYL